MGFSFLVGDFCHQRSMGLGAIKFDFPCSASKYKEEGTLPPKLGFGFGTFVE